MTDRYLLVKEMNVQYKGGAEGYSLTVTMLEPESGWTVTLLGGVNEVIAFNNLEDMRPLSNFVSPDVAPKVTDVPTWQQNPSASLLQKRLREHTEQIEFLKQRVTIYERNVKEAVQKTASVQQENALLRKQMSDSQDLSGLSLSQLSQKITQFGNELKKRYEANAGQSQSAKAFIQNFERFVHTLDTPPNPHYRKMRIGPKEEEAHAETP